MPISEKILSFLGCDDFSMGQQMNRKTRKIVGSMHFQAPAEWGVELDLWIDFDLQEVNASNHQAKGEITWRIWGEEMGDGMEIVR